MILIVIGLTLVFLVVASIYDLKKGEIPDSVSVGLNVAVLGLAFLYSVSTRDSSFILTSVAIGIFYFILAYVPFYLGQWGGGDVKVISGIGCSLGFLDALSYQWPNTPLLPYFGSYLVNMAFVATPYALFYSMVLGILKPKVFARFFKEFRNYVTPILIFLAFIPSFVTYHLQMYKLTLLYVFLPILVIVSIYLKVVELVALRKMISVSELKEGDAVADDLLVDNKKIASKRDIEGLTNGQIEKIRKLAKSGKIPKTITIRWGIRFVPILLIAFALTLWTGNLLEMVMAYLV